MLIVPSTGMTSDRVIITSSIGRLPLRGRRSMVRMTSIPSITFPKTTCLSSSQGVATVVMKNCDPFVSFPELAIERRPGSACLMLKFSSSNRLPKIEIDPVPSPLTTSPPCNTHCQSGPDEACCYCTTWIMKLGMTRWNRDPRYERPCTPLDASVAKLATVLFTRLGSETFRHRKH